MSELSRAYGEKAIRAMNEARALETEHAGQEEIPTDIAERIDLLLDQAQAFGEKAEAAAAQEKRAQELEAKLTAPDPAQRLATGAGTKGPTPALDTPEQAADWSTPAGYKAFLAGIAAQARTPEGRTRQKAWQRTLVEGLTRLNDAELKALNATTASEGGYLVPPQEFVAELIQAMDNYTYIRQLAHVVPLTQAASLGVPTIDAQFANADWTPELTATNPDTTLQFGKRELSPHQLTKEVQVSKRLLRLSPIPADQLVRDRLAYIFGITYEQAALTGTGAEQPLGVFTPSSNGISTGRDSATASPTAIVATELMDAMYALKEPYWKNSTWIFNRTVFKALRKLLDSNGQPIWQMTGGYYQGVTTGPATTLLDRPYKISEYAPGALTAATYVAIIGDFSYYWIAEVLGLEVQVALELYARQNLNDYIGRMEADGMPVLEEAFSRLIMHA